MRTPVACTAVIVGAVLLVAPVAVLLTFAEKVERMRDPAGFVFNLHAVVCFVVGLVLLIRGMTRPNPPR